MFHLLQQIISSQVIFSQYPSSGNSYSDGSRQSDILNLNLNKKPSFEGFFVARPGFPARRSVAQAGNQDVKCLVGLFNDD
jgi:hypothetical protein